MSKLLEALFDEVEFRLAKRASKRRPIKPHRVASIDHRQRQSFAKNVTVEERLGVAPQAWPPSSVLIPRGLSER